MENEYDEHDALIANHYEFMEAAIDLVWHFYDRCYKEAKARFEANLDVNDQQMAMTAAIAALQTYKQDIRDMEGR